MNDQDEDAFDHMHRAMASQGGHLVLVGEVIKECDAALAEVKRLRGLLRELEWAGGMCPICHVLPNPDRLLGARSFHDPDCWLAVEVRLT